MSQNHRYILQPYKGIASRYTCPNCDRKHKFSRYIDTTTNEPLADDCGRCERVDGCGYQKSPFDYFKDNPNDKPTDFKKWQPVPEPPQRPVSFIDKSIFNKTLGLNDTNTFITFLIALFGKEHTEMLINKYHIGTTKTGEAIFYQVDLQGNVRTGKVMKYNITDSDQTALGKDCKRDKNINPNWVHSKLKLENFNLKQCLFGEHLLTDNRTVGIIESAKSAIIGSVYFPSLVWVSCEGKEGLNLDKLKVLKGRNVVLFPDLGGFDKWTAKAKEMTFCKSVVVSDLLEKVATDAERASGLDLADYLLRLPAPAETIPVVTENVKISLGNISQSKVKTDGIAKPDPIAINDIPFEDVAISDTPNFWEEVPQISDDEFKEKCTVLDWWNKRLDLPIDGIINVDGLVIHDIKDVIRKHVEIIHKDNSAAVLSLKFLEKIKKLLTEQPIQI